jgi:MOSC domain-containing protein
MNSSERVGTIRALWRYPVKSMLGEQLDAVDVSESGVVGDRAYALQDRETGKVASAKHPKLLPNLLACPSGAQTRYAPLNPQLAGRIKSSYRNAIETLTDRQPSA